MFLSLTSFSYTFQCAFFFFVACDSVWCAFVSSLSSDAHLCVVFASSSLLPPTVAGASLLVQQFFLVLLYTLPFARRLEKNYTGAVVSYSIHRVHLIFVV